MPLFRTGKQTQKVRSTDRLPPGQKLVRGWPVLHEGPIPDFLPESWKFRIFGAVESEVVLNWPQFQALPQASVTADFHCVTTWSRYDNRWQGVGVDTILGLVRVDPRVTHVMLHSFDALGYDTNLPFDDFKRQENLFATHHDGSPLTPEHGGPMRYVCHHLYAWKSAKWCSGVEFMIGDRRGFWERNGYHKRADPWFEERYSYQEEEWATSSHLRSFGRST